MNDYPRENEKKRRAILAVALLSSTRIAFAVALLSSLRFEVTVAARLRYEKQSAHRSLVHFLVFAKVSLVHT